jgi:hypothetical protein
MARAARRAGRAAESVSLVAVTKGCGPDAIRELYELGLRDFGENRVQEALPKIALGLEGARWHLIGHLQENKIAKILSHVFMIQSVDSLDLGRALSARAERAARRVPILLEVKTAPEPSKHGVPVEAAPAAFDALAALPGLEILGLMTIGPLDAGEAAVRASFRALRRIFDDLQSHSVPPRILSMGMSDDFELAIEEGSNMVRLGRALVSA